MSGLDYSYVAKSLIHLNQTSLELSIPLCTMYTRPIEQNTGLSENPTVTEWKEKQAEHV